VKREYALYSLIDARHYDGSRCVRCRGRAGSSSPRKPIEQARRCQRPRGASLDLASLAKADPASRQYIANRLPSLLAAAAREGDLQLWISSLGLVTELKTIEAVPVLTELLRKENTGFILWGPVGHARLYDDPVAYALSEIGDPATQPVAKLFQDGDAATRRRAAIVLGNIATPQAREALVRQILLEQVDDLRAVMQDQVTYIDKKVRLGIAR